MWWHRSSCRSTSYSVNWGPSQHSVTMCQDGVADRRVSVKNCSTESTWHLNRSYWQEGDALVDKRCQEWHVTRDQSGRQHWQLFESMGPWNQVQILDPLFIGCVSLGKLLSFSGTHLQNEDNNSSTIVCWHDRIKCVNICKVFSSLPAPY